MYKHETIKYEHNVTQGKCPRDVIKSNSPGSFLVLNDALVIIDLETVTVVVDGVSATEIPMGPSLG
jgi:hypothetical protein